MPGKPVTAAVLASGNGSNAENILRFAQSRPEISIPLVVCNKPGAGVIARAEKLGVKCEVIPVEREAFPTFDSARRAQEEKVVAALQAHKIQWVLLAGYMQIISPYFLSHFPGRMVNIHPSLLPRFPGKDGYGDAFRAGVKTSGVTLHFVDEGVDSGPVIAQKEFDRHDDDTLETFRARGMEMEYKIYTEFLESLSANVIPNAVRDLRPVGRNEDPSLRSG